METRIETSRWWAIQLFHPDRGGTTYVYDTTPRAANHGWGITDDASRAHKFWDRGDSRRVARTAKACKEAIREGYFYEIVRVVEKRQVTYEMEVIGGNAPPLIQLARAGE